MDSNVGMIALGLLALAIGLRFVIDIKEIKFEQASQLGTRRKVGSALLSTVGVVLIAIGIYGLLITPRGMRVAGRPTQVPTPTPIIGSVPTDPDSESPALHPAPALSPAPSISIVTLKTVRRSPTS